MQAQLKLTVKERPRINKKRNKVQKTSQIIYKKEVTLAHDIFQDGRIEVLTVFKEVKKESASGNTEHYETRMRLHGFPLHFIHTSMEEAVESHHSFCRLYRDF